MKRLLERSPVKLINLTNYLKKFTFIFCWLDPFCHIKHMAKECTQLILSIVYNKFFNTLTATVTVDHSQAIHPLCEIVNLQKISRYTFPLLN